MADLPHQGLFQQLNARPVSGQDLEVFGKRAAAGWQSRQYPTMNDAVVGVVKEARLSPEQVRRVIEFANTSAYLGEFNKEGSQHRVIEFEGGPADPSAILKDLNDGGGGSVFDRGTLDYQQPPSGTKTAAASPLAEAGLADLFAVPAHAYPYANPFEPAIDLRDKLAAAFEGHTSEISGLEVMYAELGDRMYQGVKQAALSGVGLGAVAQAWQTIAPSEGHLKVAFRLLAPRLLREEVFRTPEEMSASVDKTAAGIPDPTHPLMTDFGEFCEVISTLSEKRATRTELRHHLGEIDAFVKRAAGGLWGGAVAGAGRAAGAIAPLAGKAERALLGGTGQASEQLAHGLIAHAPHIAAGVGGMEGYRYLSKSPSAPARAARATAGLVARNTPGTPWYAQRDAEVMYGQ